MTTNVPDRLRRSLAVVAIAGLLLAGCSRTGADEPTRSAGQQGYTTGTGRVTVIEPANRKASQSDLARRLNWKMSDGKPYHVLVKRILKSLTKAKLITIERGRITLTKKGKEAAEQLVQSRGYGTDFVQRAEQD